MSAAAIIYNPHAGNLNLSAVVELVADMWRVRGWEVTLWPTEAAGHATELARDAAQSGKRLVIAAGGDGTLGEVANGLAGSRTVMAPLPSGTANSFARELGLPMPKRFDHTQLLRASDALYAGRVHAMDLGYTVGGDGNGRYWLLWSGVGADSFAVSQIEPRPAWIKKLGRVGYALQGAVIETRFSHITARVEIDESSFENDYILILISNCRRYAGLLTISPEARLDDGLFEVLLFEGRGKTDLTRHLTNVWLGKHLKQPDVRRLFGRRIRVTTKQSIAVHTDGDPSGKTPMTCEIKSGALNLLVPQCAPAGLFSKPGQLLNDW